MAQWGDSIVTVLDPLSDTLLQSIHTGTQVQDIKIINNLLITADGHSLISWNLEVGGTVYNPGRATIDSVCDTIAVGAHMDEVDNFALSNDCSYIAFTIGGTRVDPTSSPNILYLYNTRSQKTLMYRMPGVVIDICFPQDGYQLRVLSRGKHGHHNLYFTDFEIVEDQCSPVTKEHSERQWRKAGALGPHGCHIGCGSEWVVNLKNNLLWLPPNWRIRNGLDVSFYGNFLALVGSHYQKAIIIELQP